MRISIIAAAIILMQSVQAFAGLTVRVVDGDTLDLGGIRYRLHGIDAPEAAQVCTKGDRSTWNCGQDAIRTLEEITVGKLVKCNDFGPDAYGRTIAVCSVAGIDINALMIERGMAWAF